MMARLIVAVHLSGKGFFKDFPQMAAVYTLSVPEKSLGAVLLCKYVSTLNK